RGLAIRPGWPGLADLRDGRSTGCPQLHPDMAASPPAPAGRAVWWRCNRNKRCAWSPALWKPWRRLVFDGETILAPGIGRVRVTAQLPKAGHVPVQKSDFADKFGPFPGVA